MLFGSCKQLHKGENLRVGDILQSVDGFEIELQNQSSETILVFLSKLDGHLIIQNTEIITPRSEELESKRWLVFTDHFDGIDTLAIQPISSIRIKLAIGYRLDVDSIFFDLPYLVVGKRDSTEFSLFVNNKVKQVN